MFKPQISRVEYLHSRHFIHRDIKPDNFVMGIGENEDQVNIIDFGLAKRYMDPMTNLHVPHGENFALTGAAAFASINNHLGIQQSRRDDLESLAYVLIYFLSGSLPWYGAGVAAKRHITTETIKRKKLLSTSKTVCHGCPREFRTFLEYARTLKFDAKPNYAYIRDLFRGLLERRGHHDGHVFDWHLIGVGPSRGPTDISINTITNEPMVQQSPCEKAMR
jgi:serine/threonine protein kinase